MAKGKRLPLVQVPTTAGTGSEVTPISILTTGAAEKKGVVAEVLLPDVAVLDGDLTLSLPPHVTAATGIDAMVHAIEAYTSRVRKNPLSDALAREALRLLAGNIHHVCDPAKTGDKGKGERKARRERAEVREARSSMLLGSALAGMAFANAPVAAVHALAYPLGAHFHVPHGLSNSLMLPHVLDFNAADDTAAELYAELAPIVCTGKALRTGARALVSRLAELPHEVGLPTTLRDVGVAKGDLGMLATEAMKQTRLLPNNPREVALRDAEALYRAAF